MVSTASESADLLVVTATGILTMGDQVRLIEAVRAVIRANGAVRVLLRLDQFAGVAPVDPATDPAVLWLRDDEAVQKIAIVGEERWRSQVLTIMAQPVRSIPIEYFKTEAGARMWLGVEGSALPASPAAAPE